VKSESKLQRRVLLKALGMGIAAPIAFRFSQMAVAQTVRPKRLIVYYFPHGVANEHLDMEPYLMPSTEIFKDFGANADAPKPGVHVNPDYTFNTRSGVNMLASLEPYRSQLSVVRGLYQSGQFETHDSIRAILTGDGVSSSLDQFVADELKMKSLFLGVVSRNNSNLDLTNGVLSRNAAGWRTPENDIVKAYDAAFGSISGPDPDPGNNEAAFRKLTLDLTIGEVTEMRKAVSGLTQEESKLSAHLAALENIKSQSGGLGSGSGESCLAAPPVIHLEEFRKDKAEYTSNDGTEYWQDGSLTWKSTTEEKKTNFTKLAESQAELAAYSALCGNAQVIAVQNGYATIDVPLPHILENRANESYHNDISHKGYDGVLTNQMRLDIAKVQGWFIERVARMCEILNQPDPFDAEHTALENTIIYVCSEIGDSNMHTKKLERMWQGPETDHIFGYYPAFIVGGGGGSLAPGRLITADNRPMADLLLTLAQAMGSSATTFNGMGTNAFGELLV
jgi:Protein of unknown function (DUF1552)